MPEIVIVDTSPIYYLHRLGCLEILKKIYGRIIIPHIIEIKPLLRKLKDAGFYLTDNLLSDILKIAKE